MLVLTLEYELEEGQQIKTKKRTLELATKLPEMTFRQWVGFHMLVDSWPAWLKEYAELSRIKQHNAAVKWSSGQLAEYWLALGQVVNNFLAKGSMQDILQLPAMEPENGHQESLRDTASIEALARMIFTSLAEYKPKARETFEHKGHKYVVPASQVSKVGEYEQILHMPKAKLGEVVEALQRAHVYGVKDGNGQHLLKDRRYYTDLSMVACICRRVVDGKEEEVPFGMEAFGSFVDKRMEELADLPADVAIDISFFLLNSLRQSLSTDMLAWRSRSLKARKHQSRQKHGSRKKKRSRKGGKRGAGTPPFTK